MKTNNLERPGPYRNPTCFPGAALETVPKVVIPAQLHSNVTPVQNGTT